MLMPERSNRSANRSRASKASKASSSNDSQEGDDKFDDTVSQVNEDDTNFPLFSEKSKLF